MSNQQQIDELLQSSDEDGSQNNKQRKIDQENYDNEDFQQSQSKQQYEQQEFDGMPQQQQVPGMPEQQQVPGMPEQQQVPGMPEQQVPSQYASQIQDQVEQENQASRIKDQDLSQAKSQFIESSKLQLETNKKSAQTNKQATNKGLKRKSDLEKMKEIKQQKPKIKKSIPKTKSGPQPAPKPKAKPQNQQQTPKKPQLSKEQYQQRMKNIKEQHNDLLKKKLEKQAIEEKRKKELYEQAKKKEDERKQKNKKVMQEQTLKPKVQKPEPKIFKPEAEDLKPKRNPNINLDEWAKTEKQKQKNLKKQIQIQNKEKIKQLNKKQETVKGQKKKQLFLDQKKMFKANQVKEKNRQDEQVDNVQTKYLKKDIRNLKDQIQSKKDEIRKFDATIENLLVKLKQKEKENLFGFTKQQLKNKNQNQQIINYSDQTPIEKFMKCFQQAKSPKDIFEILDANKDGVLKIAEIDGKLKEFDIQKDITEQIHKILDKNSDGNVSLEQFVFFIDSQRKKQSQYRKIMGELEKIDPLDIQAKILDMQSKTKYMKQQIQRQKGIDYETHYQNKCNIISEKIKKYEAQNLNNANKKKDQYNSILDINSTTMLIHTCKQLENEYKIQQKLLEKIKESFRKNITEKNKVLQDRVEQALKIQEEIYKLRNTLQQTQLRYLSLKKIQANKQGYLERQSKLRGELQEVYRKTQQYRKKIVDPTKQTKNMSFMEQTKFLAAVIMIQRNFRKRKGQKQFATIKENAKN